MVCKIRIKETCLDEEVHELNIEDPLFKLVFCFPPAYCSKKELISRYNEAVEAGIDKLLNYGESILYGYRVVGKGFSSIIALVVHEGVIRVAKVRRLDSRRNTLEYEGMLLEYISSYNISPRVYYWSRDIIVMDYIVGDLFKEYVIKENNTSILKGVLREILIKAYLLDKLSIDHGELNRPGTHIVLEESTKEPYIIDFESARYNRKTHNVTSLASYIFIRSKTLSTKLFEGIDKEELIARLRLYKSSQSLEHLRLILELLL